MLRVLGSRKTLCDGLTRRDLLRVGTLGLTGFGLDDWLRVRAASRSAERSGTFGQAQQCLVLYLFGAASQLESFDPKPDAPLEIRGDLGVTSTRLPGVFIGQHLPRLAQLLDRTTVVRSMTHPYPLHASAFSLTSIPTIDVPTQLNAKDPKHWPYIGSVVDYLDERRSQGRRSLVPRNVALPWLLSSRRPHPSRNGGPYGAFLGSTYDPIWTDFAGEATQTANYIFGNQITTVKDPYGGIRPDCRFFFSSAESAPADLTIDQLSRRQSLLSQFERAKRSASEAEGHRGLDRYRDLAFSLLTSPKTAEALDVQRAAPPLRERYGMNLFGQSCLVARRLLEADVRFVTVFWDEFGSVNGGWDTHVDHYHRLKDHLLPGLDNALASLIEDLQTSGRLDSTMIVCITEHGRTPKVQNADGGGRDHWSRAYSSLLAGGGFARGKVVGKTDRFAGEVVDAPVSPKDILATMYHLLGIDPEMTIHDRLGRPVPVGGEGRVREELLA